MDALKFGLIIYKLVCSKYRCTCTVDTLTFWTFKFFSCLNIYLFCFQSILQQSLHYFFLWIGRRVYGRKVWWFYFWGTSCSFQTFLKRICPPQKKELLFIFPAIETIKGGRILLQGEIWEYQGCRFHFTGPKQSQGCPQMLGPWCQMYNGAVCCAKECPGKNVIFFLFWTRLKSKDSFSEKKNL